MKTLPPSGPPVPAETLRLQALASDPRNSAWVSANAGSGKTHVLSQRVIRLLLGGADPSRILCLTYTRAAAANMSNRVFETLSGWTMLPDDQLAARIAGLEGRQPDARKLARARRLFTQALETPGGLKVQTIHAFCESVLHQFPLEANIAAHFDMLDARMEEVLFAEARRDMISGAAGGDRPQLSEAFAAVLERGGEFGLDALLSEIVAKRDRLRRFIDQAIVGDTAVARPFEPLFEEFDFGPGETAQSIAASVWPLPGFDPQTFSAFVRIAEATDARIVLNNILPYAQRGFAQHDPEARLADLVRGLLKSDGDPYDPAKAFKRAMHDRMPDLADRYLAAAAALIAANDRLALFRMIEGTQAALIVADRLIGRYEQLKAGRGFLDFNDLITRTVRLLARPDAGPWVQFKLDKGIDHILLDEAQDTSPDQWQVVRSLAGEFFAGLGARDGVERTIFAVGDEKQSIYSFQGASPEAFAESGRAFSSAVKAADRPFEHVELKLSFRSARDVLYAVDRVFDDIEVRRGVASATITHEAIRAGAPGYVELWPSVGAISIDEPEDWREPVDHASAPAVRVAENVAATIQRWLTDGEIIQGTGKRIAPGDIMVLVRKRDRFVHALSRSLKQRGIAVAGADRLRLPSHIAIKDLMALGRFLIQPEDDLSLAAVLKSPLFGLDEETLYRLAAKRLPAQSLHASLRQNAEADGLAKITDALERWANEAAFKPVFEFYAGLLGRDGGRRKFVARLGHEAGEILDEFLAFCLAEERVGMPGLEGFLTTLETAGPEIKREMDQSRDEIRILTVHASKGLEAPIVFLVDSGSAPFSDQHLPRLTPFQPKGELRHIEGFLWRSAREVTNSYSKGLTAHLGERADDEYRRLLYVGMTRAEDRLILCGYHGKKTPGARTWHSIVSRALIGAAESEALPHPAGGEDVVHRFRVTEAGASTAKATPSEDTRPASVFPAELLEPLPVLESLPRPLSPSGAALLIGEATEAVISRKSPVLDAEGQPAFAIARGLAIHKMLQLLPDIEPELRRESAERYLTHVAGGWPEAERLGAFQAVEAVMAMPAFAPIFAPGSRAEVAIAGKVEIRGKPRIVSGKIDRLAVTESEVMIVDYKTNRPPPVTLADVPESYVLQLALYAELLQPLYPGRKIAAGLLFTETPRLIDIPSSVLRQALARLTQA